MSCTAFVISCFLFAGLSTLVKLQASAAGHCSPEPQAAEISDRATCPFTVAVDVDPGRIPAELPVVKCNCLGSICSEKGDFRCQEVRSTFKVAYHVGGKSSAPELNNKTVDLTTSCVCVVSKSLIALTGGSRTQDRGNTGKLASFK
uniref:Putative secreted protein n=1 Tax=Amblyomma triste TaxID=251400 RepID=A0A023GD04_AMBTT